MSAAAAEDAEAEKDDAVVGARKENDVAIEADEKNAEGADVDMEEKPSSVAEEGKMEGRSEEGRCACARSR